MFVIKCKPFLLSILVPVLIGFISGMIILPDVGIYSMLQLPPGAPPAFVFPIVWTILYVLMGIFFKSQLYTFAFVWILLLICAVTLMIIMFSKVNKISAYLMIPYLIWCIYAAYLNLGVVVLN